MRKVKVALASIFMSAMLVAFSGCGLIVRYVRVDSDDVTASDGGDLSANTDDTAADSGNGNSTGDAPVVVAEDHAHTWGEWKELLAPTCDQAGFRVRTCEGDDTHNLYEILDPTGHTYEDGACTVCGASDPAFATEGLSLALIAESDEYVVDGYNGTDTEVIIPSVCDEKTVTGITETAFADNQTVQSVIIPESITDIGDGAFKGCSNLASVTVDENNTSYSSDGGVLFDKEQTELICYPSQKTDTEYEIPETVTTIGTSAFDDCSNLQSVTIPEKVQTIEDNAFSGCSNLTEITYTGDSDNWDKIDKGNDWNADTGDYTVTNTAQTTVAEKSTSGLTFEEVKDETDAVIAYSVKKYTGSSAEVVIPSTHSGLSVTAIDASAFADNTTITKVTIPSGVKSIGASAFENCTNLANITYKGTADEWNALTKGDDWDKNITHYTVYDKDGKLIDEKYADYVFEENSNKDGYVLTGYTGTATEVVIPATFKGLPVTEIGATAFANRSDLSKITYNGTADDWTNNVTKDTDWDKDITHYIVYDKDGNVIDGKHVAETDEAVEATCTTTGLTEGSHCSVCNTVLVAQQTVAALGHDIKSYDAHEATCTEKGWSAYEACTRGDYTTYQEIAALGHDYGDYETTTAATCTEDGVATRTCSRDSSHIETKAIDATGHKEVADEEVAATCTKNGKTAGTHCSVCDEVLTGEATIPATGHTVVTDAEVAATCTETGLTEGSHCSVCDTVLTAQTVTPIIDHNYDGNICTMCKEYEPTYYTSGLVFTLNPNNDSYSVTGYTDSSDNTTVVIPAVYRASESEEYLPVTAIASAKSFSSQTSSLSTGNNYVQVSTYTGIFNGATMTSVVLGENLEMIGAYAFDGCSSLTSVHIPSSVTIIGERAFRNCSVLTDVYIKDLNAWCNISFNKDDANPLYYATNLYLNNVAISSDFEIPDTITNINAYAFYYWKGLKSVTIPNSVTTIGKDAFIGCSNLTKVNVDAATIGQNAFENCTALTEVIFDENVRTIEEKAFDYCTALESISILGGVETIQADAFYNCSSLASVKLGENVATINPLAFEMCSSLTSITVEEGSKTYSAQDGVLYNQDKTTLVYYPLGSTATEYTVIASTETIGDYAFYNHSNLQSITLPDGLTTIGDNAFNTCFALESVIIPNTVTSIGTNAFNRCTALESVTIGSGVTSIKYDAFSNCSSTNLKKVYIYDVSAWCNISFENASSNPLSYAHNLYLNNELVTDLELPSTVNSIGNYAFDSCTSLTSVSIPESVTSIGLKAFEYCSNLTSITVNANNTVYSSDDGVLFDHDKTTLICCPAGKSGSYIISDKVEKIESYAFYYCSSLTSVTIGSGVTYIAKYAFLGCSNLTSATFTVTSSWSYSGTMTMNSSSGSSSVYTVNENVSASDLANTSTAATYIVNYSSYEWKRS